MERERTGLIEARQRRGWTLQYVASTIGADANSLRRWERGTQKPRSDSVAALCKLYNKNAIDLGLDRKDSTILMIANQVEPGTIMDTSPLKQDLTARLMSILFSWPRRNHEYQELQGQLDQAVLAYTNATDGDVDALVTRRNALRSLLLLPIEVCGIMTLSTPMKQSADDVLTYCAAGISAARRTRKGKELTLAYDALSHYIPMLSQVFNDSAQHQKAAATLLVQCYSIKAALARHVANNDKSIELLQIAERYAPLSGDVASVALAPRILAATYYLAGCFGDAAQAAARAVQITKANTRNISRSIQSFVYSGAATYLAASGQSDPAEVSLRLAHETYEAAAGWGTNDRPNLLHNDALTHFYAGQYKEAADSLDLITSTVKSDSLTEQVEHILDRVRVEATRDDKSRDMDLAIILWKNGIQGATDLHSELSFREAQTMYWKELRAAWPGEQRIKGLRELIVHW